MDTDLASLLEPWPEADRDEQASPFVTVDEAGRAALLASRDGAR